MNCLHLYQCDANEQLTVIATCQVLHLLGRVYFYLLHVYLNIKLSLDEQLTYLSAAAHLIIALYHSDKGNFIPVQLYFDVMSMIKNIYFCMAKAQINNPIAQFWIILLGTDGLEKVSRKETMVGSDTNADQLQLANQIDGAVQCINILREHPEWGTDSQRLTLKPLSNNPGSISSKHDHINLKSWKGNVEVSCIVLESCWKEGQRKAVQVLTDAGLTAPFGMIDEKGGYTILCPFRGGKVILVNRKVNSAERDQTDEEADIPYEPESQETGVPLDAMDMEPDLDDLAGQAVQPQNSKYKP